MKATKGNGAALHSHGSEETFVALTGQWEVFWGNEGGEQVLLNPFDGIVVPGGVLRGFRNIDVSEAVLLIAAFCWLQSKGHQIDTYRAIWGSDPPQGNG